MGSDVVWLKGRGLPVPLDVENYKLEENGDLLINPLEVEDGGRYYCYYRGVLYNLHYLNVTKPSYIHTVSYH